jgi:hypothetical protein
MACCVAVVFAHSHALSAFGAEWVVPTGGNAFRDDPGRDDPAKNGLRDDGLLELRASGASCSMFFRVDRPGAVDLSLTARSPAGGSRVAVRVGDQKWTVAVDGTEFGPHKIGRAEIARAGYVRVKLEREGTGEAAVPEVRNLVVASDVEGLIVDFVRNNDGNMFYWGRRGPSVHLGYETPKNVPLQYAHTEIVVPKGDDTIGSYFMANGFAEGYFGIQVNSPRERRVLFSVWSPFSTDNPRDIPEDQRVKCLGSGPGVKIGEFGNEGSGGQSYLVFPWKADVAYEFLTEVRPDGPASTVYTSWFREKSAKSWRLVASFQRPKTRTHLRGFHSFLENFDPSTGHMSRGARYGDVWVRDVEGRWHECTRARFSVDPTGGGRHRLDFLGGAEKEHFFLRNCGFFAETGEAGKVFSRQPSPAASPEIDGDALPRP